jgi:FemAB-related protein (PEP-CTERM system-associated)
MSLPVPTVITADVVIRDDVPREACAAYVAQHPRASAYHHPEWVNVIGRAFGHRTSYLTACDGERVCGVLPLVFFRSRLFGQFAVSVPFVNYGGLLADSAEAERALLDHAIEATRAAGGSHLELRHTRQVRPELAAKRHKVEMLLALEATVDGQWQALDRKLRNQIRKGEKSSLEVVVGGSELLDEFYAVFARNMRDLGTPVYSPRFFREVLAAFPDRTRVFVIRLNDGRPAAASIVHWHRDTIEVPWASAIRDFNSLSVNVFLYWHMLRFSIERGFRTFDFGRSTPGGGTFLFKKQWGAEPLQLVWEYWLPGSRQLPDLSPANQSYSTAVKVWQRLPLGVARVLAPYIVRNIP